MNTQSPVAPIALTISDISVRQDADGRYSLNDLHKAAGEDLKHRPQYWLANQQTKDLIAELENEIAGIPAIRSKTKIGTYVVKELVYAYAMWISASFSLKVIRAYDAQQNQPPGNSEPLPDGLLHITPLELAGLVEQKVKAALKGEFIAKDCPSYHYPITDWKPSVRYGHTAYLTYQEIKRVDPMSRPLYRLLYKLKKDGHDVEGAIAEYSALKLLTSVFYQKLGSLKNIFETLDRYGENIYLP